MNSDPKSLEDLYEVFSSTTDIHITAVGGVTSKFSNKTASTRCKTITEAINFLMDARHESLMIELERCKKRLRKMEGVFHLPGEP